MFGARGRVGVISTEVILRGPCEFYQVVPEGIAYVATCVTRTKEGDRNDLGRAIKEITSVGVDCLIFSCTGRVTRENYGPEPDLIKFIEDTSGKPATTTITAAFDAMQHLSMKRILLSGHSNQVSTELLKGYFERKGMAVPFTSSLENYADVKKQIAVTYGIAKPSNTHHPEDLCYTQTMAAVRRLPARNAVDGIYIPCAQWTTHKYLDQTEKDAGIPVISTHRSNVWWALRVLGLTEPLSGHGKLLETIQ